MKTETPHKYGRPILVASMTLLVAYAVMYQQLISPNDETGHAIILFMVSLLWALINLVNLLRLFIYRSGRLWIGGLILVLPAAWLTMWLSFPVIFYTKVIEIHPVWSNYGRLPSLADDGVLMVQVAVALAVLGGVLLLCSQRNNQKCELNV